MTDRYQIESQVGEDVLGAVYLADDTMLQRRVMCRHIEYGENPEVKTRDDSWRQDFGTYAGKLSTMQHPNMLTIYDVSIEDSGAFVVTQFVEGDSLAERLEQGALSQLGVYRMASDMLEALHAAHQSEIFHGALHTASIRRVDRASGGHRYLLLDLGLNQLTSMVKAEKVKVADPVLMAPELHADESEPDAKADLFMLGQLCYTALVGGHPYSDKSTEECLEVYQTVGMPTLDNYIEGLNPEFAAWVMSLIESDPEQRPKDTGEAMVALHSIKLDEPEPNVPGMTHAVSEQDLVAVPQVVTTSQPVMENTVTGSVSVEAANPLEMTQAQMINAANKDAVLEQEEREKKRMMYIIGGLVVTLVIGGLFLVLRGDGDESPSEAVEEGGSDVEEAVKKHSIVIGDATLINTQEKQGDPVTVDLDDGQNLDWLVPIGIPSTTRYVDKSDGEYIESYSAVKVSAEHPMVYHPIRFESDGEVIFPRASTRHIEGSKVGSGYEVQLRIPEEQEQSITVNLYIVQKHCDIVVNVINPKDGSLEEKKIPFIDHGVIRLPVEIDNPIPGEFYVINVLCAATPTEGKLQIGISGVKVDER